jgi:hypothetical protein
MSAASSSDIPNNTGIDFGKKGNITSKIIYDSIGTGDILKEQGVLSLDTSKLKVYVGVNNYEQSKSVQYCPLDIVYTYDSNDLVEFFEVFFDEYEGSGAASSSSSASSGSSIIAHPDLKNIMKKFDLSNSLGLVASSDMKPIHGGSRSSYDAAILSGSSLFLKGKGDAGSAPTLDDLMMEVRVMSNAGQHNPIVFTINNEKKPLKQEFYTKGKFSIYTRLYADESWPYLLGLVFTYSGKQSQFTSKKINVKDLVLDDIVIAIPKSVGESKLTSLGFLEYYYKK